MINGIYRKGNKTVSVDEMTDKVTATVTLDNHETATFTAKTLKEVTEQLKKHYNL